MVLLLKRVNSLIQRIARMPNLVWFRNDLRINDNPALSAAVGNALESVIGLFLICPKTWLKHNWGSPRVQFLMKNVKEHSRQLNLLNIPLLIQEVDTFESVPDLIARLVSEHNCSHVYAGCEFGVDEIDRDKKVKESLLKSGIKFDVVDDQTIIPVEKITNKQGNGYLNFTYYRKQWDLIFPTLYTGIPSPIPTLPKIDISSDHVPLEIDGFKNVDFIDRWLPGESEAIQRRDRFLDSSVDNYHTERDFPILDSTSTLSPWLAVGAISPLTCLLPLIENMGSDPTTWPIGAQTWQGELVWRDFYRQLMWNNPCVSKNKPLRQWTSKISWRNDLNGLDAWREGKTGVQIVDAAMKQLLNTGWMHNRLRMITAMFLTKNLLIDWRLGEQFFAEKLVDYDFPSNNGGWQWAASTGADSAPYFRVFNPLLQAKRFDSNNRFCKMWNQGEKIYKPIVDLSTSRLRAISAFKEAQLTAKPNFNKGK